MLQPQPPLSHGRPVIGIVLDWQPHGSFSARPHYAVREDYFTAVWQAGGLPVGLPLLYEAPDMSLAHVQGVVVPGGDYPSPSRWYGDGHGIGDEHPRTVVNERLIAALLRIDKPLLAICAGHQELCAATGGQLWWRVRESVAGAQNHREDHGLMLSHPVRVTPGSLLHRVVQHSEIDVNSVHHEAVRTVGHGVAVCGVAPDGVIEAIEVPHCRFALGVQWHPELLLTPADKAIFAALIAACG